MSQPCGCCAGIQIITPESEANPPGMSAINYRVGTYATFYETMLARLSTLSLNIPSTDGSATPPVYPLRQLTTREPSDPSIALLDAWAVVADVLTFYQERIANEGYLPTATERRSILELARLVNYTLRPGVSASVYLAFTVQSGFSGTIPAGTRAQSIPGSGQMPQFFETSADLDVSDAWNDLQPRLTGPQNITPDQLLPNVPSSLHSLYFQGLSTNLKIGDGIIIVAGSKKALRLVDWVTPLPAAQITQIGLREIPLNPLPTVNDVAERYIKEATSLFPGSVIASQVIDQLTALTKGSQPAAVVVKLQQLQTIAMTRNLTRFGAWLSDLLDDLIASIKAAKTGEAVVEKPPASVSALVQLDTFIGKLTLPPSLQPPSSISLSRKVKQVFDGKSDTAPRLLAAFNPAAATTLYQAWAGIEVAPSAVTVNAARVKCGLFANNFSGLMTVAQSVTETRTDVRVKESETTTRTTSTTVTPPLLGDAIRDLISGDTLTGLPLDAVYDQITVGSVVAITRPMLDDGGIPNGHTITTFHTVQNVQTVSRETAAASVDGKAPPAPTGFTAKVTQLSLDQQWLYDITDPTAFTNVLASTPVLRGTVIYAQAEELPLAEEPLDEDVSGASIELDGLYNGLESGRWAIVSGDRTDIPNTTGVTASELVMIASVSQAIPPGDTLHTTLMLATKLAYTYDSSTVTIYGNVAEATNGQTVGEVLGNGDASLAFQNFALHQEPLTYLSAATPAGAQSTLTVTVNEIEWQETDDISALGPTDHDYITQTDDSAQTTVIFGNGQNGARVPTGTANVKAVYRYGMGSAGNVDAQQISQLATQPGGVQSVINPLPATGGADPDTASQARANTPIAVQALDRLVSIQDYADFSRNFAGIGKAASVKLSNGRRQVVYVTIAGAEDIPIALTSDLYTNLVQSLQQFGDPNLPILVDVRNLKLLVIAAGIQVLANYQFEDVEPNVQAALLETFSFDQRNLGQTAFLSEAISAMQGVPGVAFVNVTIFDSVAQDFSATTLANLSTILIRRGYVQAKPAYVDSSFQIHAAELVYLTANIPDTLILTEITSTNPGPTPKLGHRRTKARRSRRAGVAK